MTHPLSYLALYLLDTRDYYDLLDAILVTPRYPTCYATFTNFTRSHAGTPDHALLNLAHSLGYRLTHVTNRDRLVAHIYANM